MPYAKNSSYFSKSIRQYCPQLLSDVFDIPYVPNKNDLHPIEKAYTHQNGVQIRNTRYRTVLIQNLGILLIVVLLGLDPPGDQMVLHGIGQRKVVVPAHKNFKVKKSFEVIRGRSAIILPLSLLMTRGDIQIGRNRSGNNF